MERRVVIVAHKFLTQPDDALVTYLNRQHTADVLHICHSFSDAPDRRSTYRWFRNGVLYREGRTGDFRGWPEGIVYLKECLCTVFWALRSGFSWDVFIGMDGLCVLFGRVVRLFGRVRKTVYWAIDFVPQNRFPSRWKNWVYRVVNRSGYGAADELWDLSPRMAEVRERTLHVRPAGSQVHRIVPYGVWLDDIPVVPYEFCEKNTLVFMGHLLEKQGVQLVIEALPSLRSRIPDIRFKIIGTGQYRVTLENLARDRGVSDCCHFLGKVEDHADLQRHIASSCAAIAPYIRSLDTWTAYADPGKVKEYLACGVPTLLTDVPWNARDIEAAGCGLVIGEDLESILQCVLRVFDPRVNGVMRQAARHYARTYDYAVLFPGLVSDHSG